MIKKLKKEAFKSTDNLSPSECAAVVSRWSRDVFSDYWKDLLFDGTEKFWGELKDTFAPMEIYVDKKDGKIQICRLSLSKEDINDLVEIGLKELEDLDDPDEVFLSSVYSAVSEGFNDESVLDCEIIKMPVTQEELEKKLDDCREDALRDYSDLERAFYDAAEDSYKKENRKRRTNRKVLKESSEINLFPEQPALKELMSTFNSNVQWMLSRSLYTLNNNLSKLDSNDEGDVVRALGQILDCAEDMTKVKKAMKRTTLGMRMW